MSRPCEKYFLGRFFLVFYAGFAQKRIGLALWATLATGIGIIRHHVVYAAAPVALHGIHHLRSLPFASTIRTSPPRI
jgi:hypothetical protein